MKIFPVVLAVFFSVGSQSCTAHRYVIDMEERYSRPEIKVVEYSHEFESTSFDRVWESIITFFASRSIPIETLEKVSGIVVARKLYGSPLDAMGLVAAGEIKTEAWIVEETLSPSQFYGSLNSTIVRQTGKVTKRERDDQPMISQVREAIFPIRLGFNVFVQRFGEKNRLKVRINPTFEPTEKILLTNGWVGHWNSRRDVPRTFPEVMARFRLTPATMRGRSPSPVSTGKFEKQFLDFIRGVAKEHALK